MKFFKKEKNANQNTKKELTCFYMRANLKELTGNFCFKLKVALMNFSKRKGVKAHEKVNERKLTIKSVKF